MKRILMIAYLLCSVVGIFAQSFLSLDSCRKLAMENNKKIKIASEEIKKAHYERKVAFAQYLPDFSLTGSYVHNQKNISLLGEDKFLPIGTLMPDGSFGFTPSQVEGGMFNGQWAPIDVNGMPFDPRANPEKIRWKEHTIIPKDAFDMDSRNLWVGVFSVVQPVFMGGKIQAYNKITRYAEVLANNQRDAGLKEVIIQVDEAYWQVVSLAGKKKLADAYTDLLKTMDYNVRQLIAEGVATQADGLSVKVKLNEAEMAQTKVDNGLRMTKMLLCQLCGLPLDSYFTLADEDLSNEAKTIPAENAPVNVPQAVLNRPELKSLDLLTKIYQKKETIVRSEMLPTVALTANYAISNPNLFNGFEKEFAGMWNVGVMVNVPLFHWGEQSNRLHAAKAETRIKRLELEEAREKIELQINQSIFKANESEKRLLAANRNMENANENLRHATLGFEEGVIPIINVTEAQTAWLKANSEWIDAQIDAKLAQTYLKKAIGENF